MPVIIQSAKASTAAFGATTVTATFPAGVTGGNTVVIGVLAFTGAINTPTDTAGNVYSLVQSTTLNGGSAATFYCTNVTGGFTNVTVTITAPGDIDIVILEYPSYLAATLDHSNGLAQIGNTPRSGTITQTTGATLLVIFGFDAWSAHSWVIPGTGYTPRQATANPDGMTMIAADQVADPGIGIFEAQFSFTATTSFSDHAHILAFLSPLSITTASPLPSGVKGTAYSQGLSASPAGSYTWSLSPHYGALLLGLSLSAGGTISGTPTVASASGFIVKATDGFSIATKIFALSSSGIIESVIPGGTATLLYSYTFSNPFLLTGPFTWSVISGALPSGLSLSSGGVLSGTPAAAGTSAFTVQVVGSATATQALSLTVIQGPGTGTGSAGTFGFMGAGGAGNA